jgi:predicted dehydrogenase
MAGIKTLEIGIVGVGGVAQARHLPALVKMKDVHIAAVCDMNEKLVKSVARKYSIAGCYSDFVEMLAKEKLDIVDITVSPKAHAPLSIQAMNAGCHVLVEKPIAESVEEADEVVKVAKDKGLKLCVVHNNLFAPMVLKAKAMIEKGQLGEVRGIDIKCPWPRTNKELANKDHWYHKLPGGLFGEVMPHTVYLARGFFGDVEPVAVHARKFTEYDWVRTDELRVILDSASGVCTVTISCSWAKNKVLIDIFGTKKSIRLDVINSVMTEYGYGEETYRSHVVENLRQGWQQFAGTASAVFDVATGRYTTGHETLIRRFIQSMKEGTELPVTAEEGREVVRVVEKIAKQVESSWK